MNCYQHQESDSIGTCKHCHKAVCMSCAVDTDYGLTCSDACVDEIKILREMMSKNAQIYGIGSKSKVPPTGVLVYGLFGIIFTTWGVYNSVLRDRVDVITLILGIGFLIFGIYTYFRVRKLGLNC